MAKRSNLIVTLGLAVFIVGAMATYLILRDNGDETPAAGSGKVAVLVADKPIPAGTNGADAANGGLVKSKVVADSVKPANALTDPTQLAGRTATLGVPEGQIITSDQFQTTQTRIGTLKIPEGKTALALELANVPGVAGFAGAGDRINIYGVVKPDPEARRCRQRKLIMQNTEVLNVNGTTLAAAPGQPGGTGLVYLLAVTPVEAERLVYLTSFESLYFSLVTKDAAGHRRDPRLQHRRRPQGPVGDTRAKPEDPRSRKGSGPGRPGPGRGRRPPAPARGGAVRPAGHRERGHRQQRSVRRDDRRAQPRDQDQPDPHAGLHDESPAMSLLLAFDKRPDAALRDIVRTGALDLLQLPVSDRMLHDAIERAVGVSRPRMSSAPAPTAAASGHGKQGMVFTVSSATGGCGKTFYATNLAYFLHQHTGKRTCIIDLDLQFGEVSTALRLRPRFTISDALAREDMTRSTSPPTSRSTWSPTTAACRCSPAPKDPSDADRIHPADVPG